MIFMLSRIWFSYTEEIVLNGVVFGPIQYYKKCNVVREKTCNVKNSRDK